MTEFEASVDRLVTNFVSRISDLARLGAYAMVKKALDQKRGAVVRQRKVRSADRESTADDFKRFLKQLGVGARRNLNAAVDAFERSYITRVLAEHDGNITHAAEALGVQRQVLQRKLQRLRRKRRKDRG